MGFTTTALWLLPLLATAYAQTTTYQIELTGASQLPPVDTTATATATISFNEDSNNITYYLDFDSIPEPTASHIHVNANPEQNGSVAIPLWQATFAPVPNSGPVSGRVASNTVTPAAFAGPLEVLPDYNNPSVTQVLSQYISTGRAYVQVHTLTFPDGFVRGNFAENDTVEAVVVPQSAAISTVAVIGSA